MFAEERKEKIMELLRQNKRTSIGELTEMFQVSGTTIRTYLTELGWKTRPDTRRSHAE